MFSSFVYVFKNQFRTFTVPHIVNTGGQACAYPVDKTGINSVKVVVFTFPTAPGINFWLLSETVSRTRISIRTPDTIRWVTETLSQTASVSQTGEIKNWKGVSPDSSETEYFFLIRPVT